MVLAGQRAPNTVVWALPAFAWNGNCHVHHMKCNAASGRDSGPLQVWSIQRTAGRAGQGWEK